MQVCRIKYETNTFDTRGSLSLLIIYRRCPHGSYDRVSRVYSCFVDANVTGCDDICLLLASLSCGSLRCVKMAALQLPPYNVRPMREEEIPRTFEVLKAIGMKEDMQTLSERFIHTWFKIHPKGFYVAVANDGAIIGVCSAVQQHENLFFLGIYGVMPKFQRQGVGSSIWREILNHVGDRNAALNAVPSQVANYRDKGGFPIESSWNSVYWMCTGIDNSTSKIDIPEVQVRFLTNECRDVIEYDERVCGFCREVVLSLALREDGCVTMVAVRSDTELEEHSESVCGYGCLRENAVGGAVVSPLYADSREIAEMILFSLVDHFPLAREGGLALMIPDKNDEATRLAEDLGFKRGIVMVRLCRKQDVKADFDKIFGQYSLDFSVF